MVHTRSSPPESDDGEPIATDNPSKLPRCEWSEEDETRFIEFLVTKQAKAGDSATFKDSIFRAASEHMEETRTKGGPKTFDRCRAKWSRVRDIADRGRSVIDHSQYLLSSKKPTIPSLS
jgi:hypothetical protein